MAARIDITGHTFNRWTALEYAGNRMWRCQCICGSIKDINTQNLQKGLSKSCGCYHTEKRADIARAGGLASAAKRYPADQAEARKEAARAVNRTKSRLYREANPELVSNQKRRCYEAKREQYKARVMDNYAANPAPVIERERRKATLRAEATPLWANKDAIKAKYLEARRLTKETGVKHHVDHDIPLRHPDVCGLHVENNLVVMTAKENWRKHNKFH